MKKHPYIRVFLLFVTSVYQDVMSLLTFIPLSSIVTF